MLWLYNSHQPMPHKKKFTTNVAHAQPTTPTQPTGDAWRYCSNLGSPEAARALVQAVLTASGTIHFAYTQAGDAESFATVPDWQAVQRELLHALHVAGHPAGRA